MKPNYWIMILIMSFTLIVPTIAEQENLILGSQMASYNVSFDLGKNSPDYSLEVNGPIYTETFEGVEYVYSECKIELTNKIYSALIKISHYNNSSSLYNNSLSSVDNAKLNVERILNKSSSSNDFNIIDRNISEYSGALGKGDLKAAFNLPFYAAQFWLDNNTSCTIGSAMPWDDGTLALIKTLHVNKSETLILNKIADGTMLDESQQKHHVGLNDSIRKSPIVSTHSDTQKYSKSNITSSGITSTESITSDYSSHSSDCEPVYVKGHYRSGKWVNAHYRSKPGCG